MYVQAHAKINAFLDVIDKREDGYHNLDMVMLPLELHDAISIEVLNNVDSTYITCDHVELKNGKYNLINKTIKEMRRRYGFKQHFTIVVHKEIPISAGLGGGSSNAAAIITALNKLLKLKLPEEEQLDLAKSLGADVPFCLKNVPARVTGIGEVMSPIKVKQPYYVILLKPEKGLSTKDVFDKADSMILEHGDGDLVQKALEENDDELLAKSVFNSLEMPSIIEVPTIQEYKTLLRKLGFKIVLMSGSGSSVFALSHDKKLCREAFKKLEKEGYEVYLTKTL